jgi:hypothetical protein
VSIRKIRKIGVGYERVIGWWEWGWGGMCRKVEGTIAEDSESRRGIDGRSGGGAPRRFGSRANLGEEAGAEGAREAR